MKLYQTDYEGDGRFVGEVEADPNPIREGEWLIPAGAVEVAPPEVDEPAYARWTGEEWEVYTPPIPEPEPEPEMPEPTDPVTIVRKLDYFSRMTNAEAEVFEQGAQPRPYRERAMLDAATQFESSHELWGLLWGMNVEAFGEDRAAELLAPSQ